MELSNDLVSQFVKMTNDNTKVQNEVTVYGTVVNSNDQNFVKLDGSELLTPVSTTTNITDGERVTVMIKDHVAVVTGNISAPAARDTDVKNVANQISEFEIVVADTVYAQNGKIDNLTADNVIIKDKLTATDAEIETLVSDNVIIKDKLTVKDAEIADLTATKLNAETANLTFATIDNLNATNIEVNTVKGNFADFSQLTADNLTAIDANIQNLESNKLSTQEATITYANIDFSNIGMAAVEKLFTDAGIINNLVVGEANITGELVGVTIKGDLIEANTLVADKLVVKGDDGLYYKLNTDGMKIEAEQTDRNSLNGSIITAKSITATKVNVDDLVAFDATIGGFKITKDSIYSGVKSSVDNTTTGVYLDNTGQINFGDSVNFIKFFKDVDNTWKLAISANKMILSSSNKDVEEVINDMDNKVNKTVKTIVTNYAISDSATVAPTSGWSITSPTWVDGKYIWSKNLTTYTDNTTSETDPVCITGAKGQTGASGASGKGISSIVNRYLATTVNSGVTTSTSGWTTSIQTMTTTNKYLWNYELITYTDNSTTTTTPVVIGVYGDKGQTGSTGSTGSDGVGIDSISEKYAVSSSSTTAPTTWYDSVQTMTTTNKYLWNYEIISYTNGSTSETLKRVIGVYGDKGQNGSNGVGITSIVEQYYLSTSNTTQVGGSWVNTVPAWVDGKYMWTRSVITYTDSTTTTTNPICVTGAKGSDGTGISSVDVEYYLSTSNTTTTGGSWSTTSPTWVDGKYMWSRTKTTSTTSQVTYSNAVCITGGKGSTGNTGAEGQGVQSITSEYYLSTSKTAQTGGSWVTTPPTWSSGKYMWTRSKIVYKNPASTVYTTAICDSSWEAVNELENNIADTYSTKAELTTAEDRIIGNVDTTLTGYVANSTFEQKTNEVVASFKSTGGLNLIRNSTGINGTTSWTVTPGRILNTLTNQSIGSASSYFLFIDNGVNTTEAVASSSRFRLKPSTKYTLNGWFHSYTKCPSFDVWCLSSTELDDSSSSGSFTNSHPLLTAQQTNGVWKKYSVSFTTPANTKSGYIRIDNNGYNSAGANTNAVHWNCLMLNEGEELPWTPHASEIYDGSTLMDATGLTIKNGAIKVQNKAGGTVLKGDTNGNLALGGSGTSGSLNILNGSDSIIGILDKYGITLKDSVFKVNSNAYWDSQGGTAYTETSVQGAGLVLTKVASDGNRSTSSITLDNGGRMSIDNYNVAMMGSLDVMQAANLYNSLSVDGNINAYNTIISRGTFNRGAWSAPTVGALTQILDTTGNQHSVIVGKTPDGVRRYGLDMYDTSGTNGVFRMQAGGYYFGLQSNGSHQLSGSIFVANGISTNGDVSISGGYLKVGGKNFRGWGFSSGNVYYLGLSGDDKYVRMYDNNINVVNGISYLGSPSGRFIKLYSTQAVDVSSDLRKKDNVLPYDTQLEMFYDLLNPISYTLKDGHSGRRHLGFIAQEVEQAMSDVGMEYKDLSFLQKAPMDENGEEIDPSTITDYDTDERIKDYEYSLAYTELISLNTHMIQKLKEENKKLKDDINKLKAFIGIE